MLWHDLKQSFHAWKPSNVAELKQFCKEEWAKIHPRDVKDSLPVIANACLQFCCKRWHNQLLDLGGNYLFTYFFTYFFVIFFKHICHLYLIIYQRVCIYIIYVCICMYINMYNIKMNYTYINIHICMYVCIYVCMYCICIYRYIYMKILFLLLVLKEVFSDHQCCTNAGQKYNKD